MNGQNIDRQPRYFAVAYLQKKKIMIKWHIILAFSVVIKDNVLKNIQLGHDNLLN